MRPTSPDGALNELREALEWLGGEQIAAQCTPWSFMRLREKITGESDVGQNRVLILALVGQRMLVRRFRRIQPDPLHRHRLLDETQHRLHVLDQRAESTERLCDERMLRD